MERAIRDVRDGFFAARSFTSLDDLNEQACAWCVEISRERRVPDAKDRTVADAFLEERPKMIELPEDEFPVEERVDVRVGKTPYVRFDMNDYSVPHIHVQRRLTVIAGEGARARGGPRATDNGLGGPRAQLRPRPARRGRGAPIDAGRGETPSAPEPWL